MTVTDWPLIAWLVLALLLSLTCILLHVEPEEPLRGSWNRSGSALLPSASRALSLPLLTPRVSSLCSMGWQSKCTHLSHTQLRREYQVRCSQTRGAHARHPRRSFIVPCSDGSLEVGSTAATAGGTQPRVELISCSFCKLSPFPSSL